MSEQDALNHYNRCWGTNTKLNELAYSPSAREAVNDLVEIDNMVQAQGDFLRSRQAIAIIVHAADKRCRASQP